MKLINLLESEEDNLVIQLIKRDCAFLLPQLAAGFLYRGMKLSPGEKFIKKSVHKNRLPKDTRDTDHKVIDNYFKETFGVGYRSEALFCTGSYFQAQDYVNTNDGETPSFVFPIGKFTALYSEKYEDMNTSIYDNYFGYDFGGDEARNKEMVEFIKRGEYIETSDISKAINDGGEIMVACDYYYALSAKYYGSHEATYEWLKRKLFE